MFDYFLGVLFLECFNHITTFFLFKDVASIFVIIMYNKIDSWCL